MRLPRPCLQILLLALAGVVQAAPVQRATPATTFVTVKTASRGSFRGWSFNTIGQDHFLGLRYTQPITTANRFQRATALADEASSVIHDATKIGKICMQATTSTILASSMSEDCLTMQIIRPHGINASSPIPVLVFFHGGGWAHGSSTVNIYNGTELVKASVAQKKPIIYVNLNYRLGIYGFLGGKEMQTADAKGTAALNAGYWDQRRALEFIANNIGAFGGDPKRVTIWGQSAGAASVAAHVLAKSGQGGLFSKAIMESGSAQLYPRYAPNATHPQSQYNAVLKATSCNNLDCLRRASSTTLYQANLMIVENATQLFSPTLDNFFHELPPSQAINSGKFADVPIIMGTNLDDGTFKDICKTQDSYADLLALFQGFYGNSKTMETMLSTYPDQVTEDCPFRPVLYGASPTDRFFGATSQYKRCVAIETDLLFNVGKRTMLSAAAKFKQSRAFGYLWAQRTATSSDKPYKGVTHSAELGMLFNRPTLTGQTDAAARQYADSNSIAQTTSHIVSALLAFVYTGNPNANGFLTWPAYDTTKRQIMQLQGTYNTTVIPDTFRGSQVAFLQSQAAAFGF